MKPHESFYRNGYENLEFDSSGLDLILEDIMNGSLRSGFSLQQKYLKTLDLRPSVIEYDDVFLEVLRKNGIKQKLKSRTLRDLTLYHIQIRVTNSESSYMDWHRDTYFDGSSKSGMIPPGIKLIYYPQCGAPSPRLHVAEGSHRTMIDNKREDLNLLNFLPIKEISSDNNSAILFDTSILHSVVPDKRDVPSIRLIYSFISKFQLEDVSDQLHLKTSRRYENEV
jgi:hypothetical protein